MTQLEIRRQHVFFEEEKRNIWSVRNGQKSTQDDRQNMLYVRKGHIFRVVDTTLALGTFGGGL